MTRVILNDEIPGHTTLAEKYKGAKILTRHEAAEYLGVGVHSVYYLTKRPDFPRQRYLHGPGLPVYFDREAIDKWLYENRGTIKSK